MAAGRRGPAHLSSLGGDRAPTGGCAIIPGPCVRTGMTETLEPQANMGWVCTVRKREISVSEPLRLGVGVYSIIQSIWTDREIQHRV